MVSVFSFVNRVVNPLVRVILWSPFHSLLDGSLIAIAYVGRVSGREFSLVAQYAQLESQLIVVVGDPERKKWWRNFRQRASANVRLRGRWLACVAETPKNDLPSTATKLAVYCSKFPRLALLHGLQPKEDGQFGNEAMVKAARNVVMVVFELPPTVHQSEPRRWTPLGSNPLPARVSASEGRSPSQCQRPETPPVDVRNSLSRSDVA
jgi:hypothetical protein